MGKHVKTYGEIQYYLYDGDKKEKKVTRDTFMGSKDVAVTHNSPKPKQTTTTSMTGKVIESFDKFNETFNSDNLPLNFNAEIDFKTNQAKKFDGGDGNSGTNVPEPFIPTIKKNKKLRGSNTKQKQEVRAKERKEKSRNYRLAKNMDYQTTDDVTKFAPIKQPTVHAGGAM